MKPGKRGAPGGEAVELRSPYRPRPHFAAYHRRKERWAVIVAHRRAGKTVACVNDLIRGAARCSRPEPRLAYIAPLYNQAKDIAWNYLKHYTQFIPGVRYHESELRADLPGGARIRLYGADNPERLRGLYLDGVVLDEFADMDPRVWSEVIRPTLSDRAGWAVFIGTPRGRNGFWDIWRRAETDPGWFALRLPVSATGLIAAGELADARQAMTEDQYAQEYECSFAAAAMGSYYAREIEDAENSARIGAVPWDPELPVMTAWDLGIGDSTAIWFAQRAGKELWLIDYLEQSGVGLDWYADALRARGYDYTPLILPHDAGVRELGSGLSRLETVRRLGFEARVLKPRRLEDGINAARLLLPQCWFDRERCARGIEALRSYRRAYDTSRKVFADRPLHDWTSHGADAFRYLAFGEERVRETWTNPLHYEEQGIV